MSNWIHRLFNPHCEHCLDERQESKICQSCETLRQQLESVNHEKNKLLDRILERPVEATPTGPVREVTAPVNVPWNVRRQMLEREDRERAKLLRDAPKPQSILDLEKKPKPVSIEDLETELNIVAREREG